MDGGDWHRAQDLFERLVDLPTRQREELLAEETDGDPELRARVAGMLADDTDIDAGAIHRQVLAGLDEQLEGLEVGPYRVLRGLGQGGMGLVFLAERVDGESGQRVAIKLLRRGLDARRFRVERTILAKLHHPNIARLIDGGTLDDGRPYVVMEYIEGQPIDAHCDGAGLGLRQRLSLFLTLCGAVEHAHRNLVIHRDLKPANILIDRSGDLKLLDFGIAKLLEPELITTRTAERRLTPAYASPEQIQGQPISTGSDVYSLGVLLHELLCGCRPFFAAEGDPRAFEHAVSEGAPDRPSEVRGPAGTRPWSRALRGDLDTIILKALSVKPDRRYRSVRALADDLRRHLEGHPIKARPVGAVFRFAKFIGRHRLATASLLAVGVVAGVQQQRVLHERDLAAQQRDLARLERDQAQRERDAAAANPFFMIDLFSQADSPAAQQAKSRELIDQGARQITEQFDDDPVVSAQLATSMGSVYEAMGRYQSAARLYTQALQLERQVSGVDSLAAAEAMLRLSRLHFYKGLYAEAEPLARDALVIFDRNPGIDALTRAGALDLLGSIARYRGEIAEAERQLSEGLTTRLRLLGDASGDTGTSLNNLAGLRKDTGRFAEAIELYERAVHAFRKGLGEDHPNVIMGLNNLAQALHHDGRTDEAERVYRDALERHRRVLGDEAPSIADILENLGVLLMDRGRLAEARPLLEQALSNRQEWLGENHPRTANTHANLGRLWHQLGNPDTARGHFEMAHRIFADHFGEDHWRAEAQAARLASLDGERRRSP